MVLARLMAWSAMGWRSKDTAPTCRQTHPCLRRREQCRRAPGPAAGAQATPANQGASACTSARTQAARGSPGLTVRSRQICLERTVRPGHLAPAAQSITFRGSTAHRWEPRAARVLPRRMRPGGHLDAHRLEVHGVLQLAHAARRGQQRLGRHAAAVHARAADVVPLDDGHLQALRARARAPATSRWAHGCSLYGWRCLSSHRAPCGEAHRPRPPSKSPQTMCAPAPVCTVSPEGPAAPSRPASRTPKQGSGVICPRQTGGLRCGHIGTQRSHLGVSARP